MYWIPVLSRDVLHAEYLGQTCAGDVLGSMEVFVQKVGSGISNRFRGEDKPGIVFTDRRGGFYHTSTGYMANEHKAA